MPTSPAAWEKLLEMMSNVIDQADSDRKMMEHSLDKSSSEMTQLYNNLKQQTEVLLQKESQLRQSQKMEALGSLAGTVAHDFNNLLAVIVGYGELIQSKLSAGDPLEHYANSILHAASRGSDLTKQLLAFTRQQVIQPKVLNLNQTLLELRKLIERVLGETVKLHIQCEENLHPILADQGQFDQVIMNIVINARDALSSTGGAISIKAYNTSILESSQFKNVGASFNSYGPGVMIEIQDTGSGIPPEILPRIFEPLFTTKDKGKGTGLGLATVLGIIEQSQGGIQVESDVGKGTTFKMFFPMTQVQQKVHEVTHKELSECHNETILVVEDEPTLLDIVCESLERHGYTTIKTISAHKAIELLSQNNIDMLITDVIMPEMGGGLLAKTLKEQKPDLKVLFMSGYTDDAVLKHGVKISENAFIQKPFNSKQLLSKVQEVLLS